MDPTLNEEIKQVFENISDHRFNLIYRMINDRILIEDKGNEMNKLSETKKDEIINSCRVNLLITELRIPLSENKPRKKIDKKNIFWL